MALDFNDAGPQPRAHNAQRLALAYAKRGWPVFPCNPLNKRPVTEHGFKQATADKIGVVNFWAKWPNAMVGVPTGPASGFWVLDVDDNADRDKFGVQSLANFGHPIEELKDYPYARTAGGGYHFFFRFDPDRPVTNRRGDLPRFVDVRGDGGYVIAPGSVTADGRQYAWENTVEDAGLTDAPDWLYDALRGSSATPSDQFNFNNATREVSNAAERAKDIEPGTWHERTRDLVARLAREGASDETIATLAPRFTEAGYTHAQTVAEFLTHARTAREKWGYQPKDLEADAAPLSPTEEGKPRFRFNLTFFDDIPEEHHKTWLIRDIFGAGEFSILYGAPGSGKSVLIGDAACHVGAGLPWFGRKTIPQAVIYIAAERAALVKRRLAAWRKRHGILNLPVVVLDGLFDFASNTTHGEEVSRIADHIKAVTGYSVGWVIIDTKAQVMGGKDENASQDISVLNHNIARIQQTGAHVTIVDHTPQADPTRMKGNGGLAGAADGSFLVMKEGQARIMTIGSKPPNDGPDSIEIAFSLEGVVLGTNAEGEKTEAPVVVAADPSLQQTRQPALVQPSGPLQQKIMTVIERAARDGQKLGFNRLSASIGGHDGSLGKALRKLCERGLIIEVPTQEGGKFWTLP